MVGNVGPVVCEYFRWGIVELAEPCRLGIKNGLNC